MRGGVPIADKSELSLRATTSATPPMLRRFGDTGVPRTVVGGVVVEGVDEGFEQRIKQLCR